MSKIIPTNPAEFTTKVGMSRQEKEKQKSDIQNAVINQVAGGSPNEVFANYDALIGKYQNGKPVETKGYQGVKLVLDTGHIWFYNIETLLWQDAGVYQAVGIDENVIREINDKPNKNILNLFNKETITSNTYLNVGNGELLPITGFFTSDFIDIYKYRNKKIVLSNTHMACLYDNSKQFVSSISDPSSVTDLTISIGNSVSYIRVVGADKFLNTLQVGKDAKREEYYKYNEFTLPNLVLSKNDKTIMNLKKEIDGKATKSLINLYDFKTNTLNKYLNVGNGALITNTDFQTSDFIDISYYQEKTINLSNTHMACLYDKNKVFVKGIPDPSSVTDLTIEIPLNVFFIRVTTSNKLSTKAQVGENVSRLEYYDYGKYILPNFVDRSIKKPIIVDLNGSGDYISFTKAMFDNANEERDVIVKTGTYNIRKEYEYLFGKEFVDTMDNTTELPNKFQYGIKLNNKHIKFEPGSKLNCDWTGLHSDGNHRFSPLCIWENVILEDLYLVTKNTFYAIHDDYGKNPYYRNEFIRCHITGSVSNHNLVGGGCFKHSLTIYKDCYFQDYRNDQFNVRYHNTFAKGSMPKIEISNTYFSGKLGFFWYGEQLEKMKVYVNNCSAVSITKQAEKPSENTPDNIDLFKWMNEERGAK